MAELLAYLARELVDDPDAVRVDDEERDGALVLVLHVAADDVGKVIGRQGRIARALRTLVRASAAREGRRVMVEIADPSECGSRRCTTSTGCRGRSRRCCARSRPTRSSSAATPRRPVRRARRSRSIARSTPTLVRGNCEDAAPTTGSASELAPGDLDWLQPLATRGDARRRSLLPRDAAANTPITTASRPTTRSRDVRGRDGGRS